MEDYSKPKKKIHSIDYEFQTRLRSLEKIASKTPEQFALFNSCKEYRSRVKVFKSLPSGSDVNLHKILIKDLDDLLEKLRSQENLLSQQQVSIFSKRFNSIPVQSLTLINMTSELLVVVARAAVSALRTVAT